jgi:hypothetical protein
LPEVRLLAKAVKMWLESWFQGGLGAVHPLLIIS